MEYFTPRTSSQELSAEEEGGDSMEVDAFETLRQEASLPRPRAWLSRQRFFFVVLFSAMSAVALACASLAQGRLAAGKPRQAGAAEPAAAEAATELTGRLAPAAEAREAAAVLLRIPAHAQQNSRLRITNGCTSEPIWIAHEAGAGTGPDKQNIKIGPSTSHDCDIPDNLVATRYWPKLRCDENGQHCVVGESGGPEEVCDPLLGCGPPVDTKFEATFGQVGQDCTDANIRGCDYLDVSLVDGFTVPFKLEIKGDCNKTLRKAPLQAAPKESWQVIDCSQLSLDACPFSENMGDAGSNVNLTIVNPITGDKVGCYSPCSKLTFRSWNNTFAAHHSPGDAATQEFCCPTPPESAEACRAGPVISTNFVRTVHEKCPGIYAYAYDDGMGLMKCPAGTFYEMTFYCPNPMPRGQPRTSWPSLLPSVATMASPAVACATGGTTACPGLLHTSCAGNACCPDGTTCPSADENYTGCPKPKSHGCPTASSSTTRPIGLQHRSSAAPSSRPYQTKLDTSMKNK